MYNEEVKKEYLNGLLSTSVRYATNSIFRNSFEYEEHFGKDLYDFIEPEIVEFLTGMNAVSFASLHSRCSLLRTYTEWCISKKISKDGINHYDSITTDIIESCVNKFGAQKRYVSYEELKEITKDFINVSDSAVCFCLFFGIYGFKGKEIIGLTLNDIEESSGKITLNTGRIVKVPHEVVSIFVDSCNQYDYILPGGRRFSTLPLSEDDPSVFKRRANARFFTEENNYKRIVNRLKKIKDETGCPAIGVATLKNSGLLWQIKQYIDKNPVSGDLYDDENVRSIFKKMDMTLPPARKVFHEKIDKYLNQI